MIMEIVSRESPVVHLPFTCAVESR